MKSIGSAFRAGYSAGRLVERGDTIGMVGRMADAYDGTGAVRLAAVLRGVTTRLAQADHVHDPDVRLAESLDRYLTGESEIDIDRRVRDQQARDARRERRRDRAVRVLRALGATALGIALSRREGADL